MSDKKGKIYFSYAWRDEHSEAGKSREDLVTKIYNSLKNDGFDVRIDKENCSYGESISNFIEEIGKGDLIIVFTSDKYVKSAYCMRELFLVAQNNAFNKDNFSTAILPVLVEFIKFDDPEVLDTYFDYWNDENEKWQKFMAKHRQNANREQSERAHIVQDIQQKFGTLSDWITDINASNNKLLQENDFEIIKQKITERIGKPTITTMQENDCPKTYEEFKKYVAENPLFEVFDMIDRCFYNSMEQKSIYNARKKQHLGDKLGIFTEEIKEVLPMLVKKDLA